MISRLVVATLFLFLAMPPLASPATAQNQSVDIVYCEYRPFFFKGVSGEPRGLLVDFWRLWSRKTGIPITFSIVESWEKTVEVVKDGSADINAAIFRTPEREKHLDFSDSFFNLTAHIFYYPSMPPPQGLEDLSTKRIGIVSSDYTAQYLKSRLPEARYLPYPDYEKLVLGAINHEVDAFLMAAPVAMSYLAKHDGLETIRRVDPPLYSKRFLAGVREGNKQLVEQINKGIDAISEDELGQIIRNWTGLPEQRKNAVREVTVITSNDHIPYYYTNRQGQMTGMLIDIWRLWSEKTGIDVTFKGASFAESLDAVKKGKADIHGGCFFSKRRDSYLDYAGFLANSKTHFFFHESVYGIKNLQDLVGFKIGVMAQDFAIDYIRQHLPGAVIAEYSTNEDLYKAVKNGEVRAFVGDTLTALFYLAEMGILHEWRHHADRPLYGKAFYAAVGEGNREMLNVVKAGMMAISPQERAAIERRWTGTSSINTKDTLVVALPIDQAPYSMLDPAGNPAGMFADLWQRWAEQTGARIELRGYSWQEAIQAVKNGEADIHGSLSPGQGEAGPLAPATPFYTFPVHLFHPAQIALPNGLEASSRLSVGVVRGTSEMQWLSETYPKVRAIAFESGEAMAKAANQGTVQAFIAAPAIMLPTLSRLGWRSSFRYERPPLFFREVGPAVAAGNRELLSRIEAGFNSIQQKERSIIEERWVSDASQRFYLEEKPPLLLTREEKQWLRTHTITIGTDPDRAPFEYVDEQGRYQGMVSDYMRLLSHRLGLKTQRAEGLSWSEITEQASGTERNIDIIPCIVPTEERKDRLMFSTSYLSFPWVLITRKQSSLIGSIRDLYERRVAVVKGYAIHDYLRRDHPQIQLYEADSVKDALQSVSTGEIAAYAGNLVAATYQIEQNNFTNLKVAASTPYGSDRFAIGVRSDWPMLLQILDKGIQSLTQQEHDTIRRKWFATPFKPGYERAYVMKMALRLGAAVLVVFAVVLLWNYQIRRREERFRGLIEHGTDIIQALREDGTITYQSPSHKQVLGYTPNELVGQPIHGLLHPEDQQQWRDVVSQLKNGEDEVTFIHRLLDKNGCYRYFESHCINLPGKRGRNTLVINGRDLSERMQVEADLQKAKEEAETANKAKSEFLAKMSHEIRTPLNAILGLTEITLRTGINKTQKQYLGTAREAAKQLMEIINDILDLSKIESGKLRLRSSDFDLAELLESVRRTYETEARQKDITLDIEFDPELPRHVHGDSLRLRQVLINLVGNAVKFTERGGILLRAQQAAQEEENPCQGRDFPILLSVADTGIGIPAEKTATIFDSFTQEYRVLQSGNGGVGLGLAICKNFVDLLQGKIWLDSRVNQGTTFFVRLCLGPPHQNEKTWPSFPDTEASLPPGGEVESLDILLAEDSQANALVAVTFLAEMGHKCTTVTDGREALKILSEQTFDLVLMDLQMPEVNGLEAAIMIREGHGGKTNQGVPIIAMTAHVLDEYRQQCFDAGMNGFLTKPVEFEALAREIASAMSIEVKGSKEKDHQAEQTGTLPVLDREAALRLFGGDRELMEKVNEIFVQETPPIMEELKTYVLRNDCQAARIAGHTVKGGCARIGAKRCEQLAARLEKAAGQEDLETVRSSCQELEVEFDRLLNLLKQGE